LVWESGRTRGQPALQRGWALDSLQSVPVFFPVLIIRSAARSYLVLALSCLLLTGCATTPSGDMGAEPDATAAAQDAAEKDAANDPFEGFNRAMYTFNDTLDRYFLKPVAQGYRAVTPKPVRTGVSNFFSNLFEPIVMLNSLLQGKVANAGSDLGRFVTNSTVGLFGLFDVASHWGMARHEEDFGQTLGKWGFSEGPYLVLPILGPSTIRDGVGTTVDFYTHPVSYMEQRSTATKVNSLRIIDARSRLLEAGDILEQAAGDDPYIFVREAYRQRRRSLVTDGAAEGPADVDPSIFED
jgi:phospholipid-binding lipoprotein MlaA